MQVTPDHSIGDIVRKNFRAASVFERNGIDFCCGGGTSLGTVCTEKGIDAHAIITELSLLNPPATDVPDFDSWPLDKLIDHILEKHHRYVRESLPVVQAHAQKVASVHGERHPETISIARIFDDVREELEGHMFKEEQILFPFIKSMVRLKTQNERMNGVPFGSVRNPISMMEMEHESAGSAMQEIRKLGNGLVPPDDACNTFRVLYQELDEFERDLHEHIHLENNILFPEAIVIEKELLA